MCRSNPLPSTLPSSPFCSTLNTSSITASDMCEVCTEAVHSTLNTSYITGFAVCSYLTHLWCSYSSPKTRISVFLFDAFVVFLFEPGPLGETKYAGPFFFEPWILDGSLDLEIFDTHLSIHAIGCDGTVFHTNSACRRKIADTVCKRIPFFALLL